MLRLESARLRAVRWISAVAVVATLHAGAVAWALRSVGDEEWESQASGAFIVELSSITASPDEDSRDVAVGARSNEVAPVSASAPQIASTAEPPRAEEQPIIPETSEDRTDAHLARLPEEKPPDEEKPEEVAAAQAEDAPLVAPVAPSEAAAPQRIENATETSNKPRGQTEGVSRVDRVAIVNWQRDLIAHMNRYKRYPEAAREARRNGIVTVSFAIDRQGRVVRTSIANSAGFDALDQAAIDMLRRASPLPPPPDSVAGETIDFAVPVRFRWKN